MRWRRVKVYFGKIRDRHSTVYGQSWDNNMEIDLKVNTNPLRTFLHEQLHLLHPDLSEKQIWEAERRIWRKMTQRERFLLGRMLFNRKFRMIGEDE